MDAVFFDKALTFAALAHKGQTRKGTDIPYITHPYAVGMILCEQKCDTDSIIAGILHDVLEDTPVTEQEIRNLFGTEITAIVKACSEPDKSLPWEERKQHTITKIRSSSLQVKYVTCADKLHNFRSMQQDYERLGDKLWERFSRGYDQQKWYAQSVAGNLVYGVEKENYKNMFTELIKLTEEFFA